MNIEWISVKERLPELDQQVLTYSRFGIGITTFCRQYDRDKFEVELDPWFDNDSWTPGITHWMPVPGDPIIL